MKSQTAQVANRSSPSIKSIELEELVARASAISFDFFDTLFLRPLARPEDAFDILGRQFAMPNFRKYRRAAQAQAFQRMLAVGRKEITLEDIYLCFPETTVANAELMNAEYTLELALLEPNPEVFALFSSLVSTGKPVVITSDMYFPVEFFKTALGHHGLAPVQLFVSADRNATKRDKGELFDAVIADLGIAAGDILHIGDNLLADVTRPREKGMLAFHYRSGREQIAKETDCLATSIGLGLLGASAKSIPIGSYTELGFLYGGAANIGFLEWIRERARIDDIGHILFLSRDGYSLARIADQQENPGLPESCYFLGSRTAYTLAAINADNFNEFLPFFLSGADGLAPCELLERIGVQAPSHKIMVDLQLGHEVRINSTMYDRVASFLYAYRWEILKVCQRNRRVLYQYLKEVGIKPGARVALVDVGWNGTTQEAFERATAPLMKLEVFGYYFCLADTPERSQREVRQKMAAMVNASTTSNETVASLYANRVAVEQFFSAPHSSVIGLKLGVNGVEPVIDAGRGDTHQLLQITTEVCNGIEAFAEHYSLLQQRVRIPGSPLQTAWPLIKLLTETRGDSHKLLGEIKNFDAWGSSRNHELRLADYLTTS